MHQYLRLDYGIVIPTYNLLVGIGAVCGFLQLEREFKIRRIDPVIDRRIYLSLIVSIIVGFAGARIFEMVYHGNISILSFFRGGITFMGGLIAAMAMFTAINSFLKINQGFAFNLLTPAVIIAHCIGRLGCFFAGCCYGRPTDTVFGVHYPESSLPATELGANLYLHPIQIYEAVFLLFQLIIITRWIQFNDRFFIYLISYGLYRFFAEFLRGDDRGQFVTSVLTPSQAMSVLFISGGIFIGLVTKEKCRKYIYSSREYDK